MAPSLLQQRRTHNGLLFQKLLNLRDGASPFTVVLDTLEQSGGMVVGEFVRRAKIGKSKIIIISYSTLRKKVPFEHDIFISARSKPLALLRREIVSHLPLPSPTPSPQKYLLIIDTLHPLATSHPQHLSSFLSSLLTGPTISLLATHHTDIPLPLPPPYAPDPLTTLTYLATAILTVHSFAHVLAAKRARDKSLPEPIFAIPAYREGILVAPRASPAPAVSVVVEMELRRKSGRGVRDVFVLGPGADAVLLDDHPLYATLPPLNAARAEEDGEDFETTFSLGLSEKQRRDREGVVLPYFDAQRDGGASGAGEGGRILYEMGAEDREDFDDEEDEI